MLNQNKMTTTQKLRPNKPIPLIHRTSSNWEINSEIKNILNDVSKPVKVLCIAGPFRKGKSYILNAFLGVEKDGFELGHGVNGKTRGIWIWVKEETDHTLICLDTEGLFDPNNPEPDIDIQIFTLSMLLSSYLIINVQTSLDRNIIENCQMISEITKYITTNVKNQNSTNNIIKSIVSQNLPSLLFLIRDFTLDLEEFKNPKDYLIKSLSVEEDEKKGRTDLDKLKIQTRNNVRKGFLNDFKAGLNCETLICPVDDMKNNLKKIETDPSVIKPEFKNQVDNLIKILKIDLKTKKMFDGNNLNQFQEVSETGFVLLLNQYVQAINNDILPNIGTTFDLVLNNQTQELKEKAIIEYKEEMKKLVANFPIPQKDLNDLSNDISVRITSNILNKAFIQNKNKLLNEFRNESDTIFHSYIQENIKSSDLLCQKIWEDISKNFTKKLIQCDYNNLEEAKDEGEKIFGDFKNQTENKCPTYSTFIQQKNKEYEIYFDQLIQKLKLDDKIKEAEKIQNQLRDNLLNTNIEIDRLNSEIEDNNRKIELSEKQQKILMDEIEASKKKFEDEKIEREKEFNNKMNELQMQNKLLADEIKNNQNKFTEELIKAENKNKVELNKLKIEYENKLKEISENSKNEINSLKKRLSEKKAIQNNCGGRGRGGCTIL